MIVHNTYSMKSITPRQYKCIHRILLLLLIMASGCHSVKINHASDVFYPPPPDYARIQFLKSYSNSIQVTGNRKGLRKIVLGEEKNIPIGKLYGIATKKGKIYLCDASISGIQIIDLDKNSFTTFTPTGRGQLRLPLNCVLDQEGQLYVTDGQRGEVVIFDAKLNFLRAIGKADTVESFKPLDISVTNDKIWVTDAKSQKIHVYQKENGQLLYTIPGFPVSQDTLAVEAGSAEKTETGETAAEEEEEDEEEKPEEKRLLYNPINLWLQDHKVYVTDFGDFKIKILTEEGKLLGTVGQYGKGLGQFVRPKGISMDKDHNLFVVDAGFENVQMFNPEGKLLMFFGGPYKGPGDMWLPAKVLVDYENKDYFSKWVSPDFEILYLIFVTNQYGPDKLNVYAAIRAKT